MAFMKTARARVARTSMDVNDWNTVVRRSVPQKEANIRVASNSNLMKKFAPDKYLLTHCTIIASVDVDKSGPANDRGWHYRVTPDTQQYINNNFDCWERDLLLQTFHTFKSAENYLEHIQIPELSKGKILDAVARDLGDTVYVDILVATDRKHTELVADIESGKMSTLSMGCSVSYCTCTYCGNVAHDDTDTCAHIKYQKGNTFYDEKGNKQVTAELCGHKDDPNSVVFIEASWVATPAFRGAVKRNIVPANIISASQVESAFSATRPEVPEDAFSKAASEVGFDFGDDGDEEDEEKESEEEKAPFDDLTDDVKKYIKDRVKREIHDDMRGIDRNKSDTRSEDTNENLVRSSVSFRDFKAKYASSMSDLALYRIYEGLVTVKSGGWSQLDAKGFTGREILAISHFLDQERQEPVLPQSVYEAISEIGSTDKYASSLEYLKTVCARAGVTRISSTQAERIVKRGLLYSKVEHG